jgi:hypothetical protein
MLSRDAVLHGLTLLAEQLNARGIEVTIHVIGGAAVMLTARPDRQLSSDVDAWINCRGNEALRTAVIETVKNIARANLEFPDDWLNDTAAIFIPEAITGDLSDWSPLIRVGRVAVVVASADVLLAMKLLAGRGRRDIPDLQPLLAACGFTTAQQVKDLFDRMYPDDEMGAAAERWIAGFGESSLTHDDQP